MDLGPMGPIGEGGSLLLRINRNCPWNRCLFCPVYKGQPFSVRTADEIRSDIDAAARTWSLLDEASWATGLGGRVTLEAVRRVVRENPGLYGSGGDQRSTRAAPALHTLNNVVNWLHHGARCVFLQDADALAMNPEALAGVLQYLKKRFPSVDTVTAYARAKTCSRRSAHDLAALCEGGLTRCLVGIESGSDAVLAFMHKGVTAAEHVEGCLLLKDAGLRVAAFVMPGLGGGNPGLGDHMDRTIHVLNLILPEEVRVRSLAVIEGSPLHERVESGDFVPPTEEQMIDEIGRLIEGIGFDCDLETLQMTNSLFAFRGPLSGSREALLSGIARFKTLPVHERARVLVDRCIDGGYLDFAVARCGHDERIDRALADVRRSIDHAACDAMEKADMALRLVKSKGIP